jgi:DNA-binding transcriptional ArsR family regulator
MPNQLEALDQVFHALAHPARRAVLNRLGRGPATVSDLARPFAMALPSFLQHLSILEDSGLIRSAKRGRVRTCEIERGQLARAETWIADQRAMGRARADRLAAYAEELARRQPEEET